MKKETLDCRNLNCPMPIVKISQAFKNLEIGDQLEVLATDPAFKADVEAWVRKTGQELSGYIEESNIKKVILVKKV